MHQARPQQCQGSACAAKRHAAMPTRPVDLRHFEALQAILLHAATGGSSASPRTNASGAAQTFTSPGAVGAPGDDGLRPRRSPARHGGLSPAVVLSAESSPLRSPPSRVADATAAPSDSANDSSSDDNRHLYALSTSGPLSRCEFVNRDLEGIYRWAEADTYRVPQVLSLVTMGFAASANLFPEVLFARRTEAPADAPQPLAVSLAVAVGLLSQALYLLAVLMVVVPRLLLCGRQHMEAVSPSGALAAVSPSGAMAASTPSVRTRSGGGLGAYIRQTSTNSEAVGPLVSHRATASDVAVDLDNGVQAGDALAIHGRQMATLRKDDEESSSFSGQGVAAPRTEHACRRACGARCGSRWPMYDRSVRQSLLFCTAISLHALMVFLHFGPTCSWLAKVPGLDLQANSYGCFAWNQGIGPTLGLSFLLIAPLWAAILLRPLFHHQVALCLFLSVCGMILLWFTRNPVWPEALTRFGGLLVVQGIAVYGSRCVFALSQRRVCCFGADPPPLVLGDSRRVVHPHLVCRR